MTGTLCLPFGWGSWDVITDNGAASSVPKWYVTTMISIYIRSAECLFVKNSSKPPPLPTPVADEIQVAIQYKNRSRADDGLWRQCEREAVATASSRRPYVTPEWRWIWHAFKIYEVTAFMLNGLHRNMSVFLEDNVLILEHKESFGFIPYPSSVLIYKIVHWEVGSWTIDCPVSGA